MYRKRIIFFFFRQFELDYVYTKVCSKQFNDSIITFYLLYSFIRCVSKESKLIIEMMKFIRSEQWSFSSKLKEIPKSSSSVEVFFSISLSPFLSFIQFSLNQFAFDFCLWAWDQNFIQLSLNSKFYSLLRFFFWFILCF